MQNKEISNVLSAWRANIVKAPSKSLQIEIFEQIASMFATGPFYYCIYDFVKQRIEFMSDSVKSVLGITPEDCSLVKFFKILHPIDVLKMPSKEKISGNFFYERISSEDRLHYKTVYLIRLKNISGKYQTILHQATPINISEDGMVQQVIVVHTDVTHLNIPFNHKVSFIGNNRPSYHAIKSKGSYKIAENHFVNDFSKREIEIIKKIMDGKNYKEIAVDLFIAPNTVNTHKRKILKKAECKNSAELIKKCICEGVV